MFLHGENKNMFLHGENKKCKSLVRVCIVYILYYVYIYKHLHPILQNELSFILHLNIKMGVQGNVSALFYQQ